MDFKAYAIQLVSFLSGLSALSSYSIVIGILLACGLGVPIPEDITLITAGILAALDRISLTGAIIAGMFGVLAGDTFLFFLGRKLGHRVTRLPVFKWIFTPERIALAEKKIINNSGFICFTARFLPGLRAPVYLTSGIMGVSPKTFFFWDGFAALISVPVWVVIGWWFGKNIDAAFNMAKDMQVYMLVAVVLLILGFFAKKKLLKVRLASKKSNESVSPGISDSKS